MKETCLSSSSSSRSSSNSSSTVAPDAVVVVVDDDDRRRRLIEIELLQLRFDFDSTAIWRPFDCLSESNRNSCNHRLKRATDVFYVVCYWQVRR